MGLRATIIFFVFYGVVVGLLLRALLAPIIMIDVDYSAYSMDVFVCGGLGLTPSYSARERSWVFVYPDVALGQNYYVARSVLDGLVCCGFPPRCVNNSLYIVSVG